LERDAISKVQKAHFLYFGGGRRINYCARKKFKTTKNVLFGLFSGAKIDFFATFESANGVFLYFWNCIFFSDFRALCNDFFLTDFLSKKAVGKKTREIIFMWKLISRVFSPSQQMSLSTSQKKKNYRNNSPPPNYYWKRIK